MIREAEQFAQTDRERRERVEKRNRAESLANEAERQLKEVTLDFGNQFAGIHRRRIEALVQEMRQAITRHDERAIDRAYSDLQDALYELKREVQLQYSDEDEDDFFGGIRRAFSGESDKDRYWERSTRRDSYEVGGGRYGRERESVAERSSPNIPRRESRPAPLQNDWDDDDDDWF
jgi:molecular chaperone DnaK